MVGSMSKPNKRKYNSFFIREFNQNEEVDMEPQYHYTSPDGFLSIVKNNCLRFTDISFLNDVSESIYMLKVICDYFCEYPQKFPRVDEIPLDSSRKMMTTIHENGEKYLVLTKGDPEIIIGKCKHIDNNGSVEILDDSVKETLTEKINEMKKFSSAFARGTNTEENENIWQCREFLCGGDLIAAQNTAHTTK